MEMMNKKVNRNIIYLQYKIFHILFKSTEYVTIQVLDAMRKLFIINKLKISQKIFTMYFNKGKKKTKLYHTINT